MGDQDSENSVANCDELELLTSLVNKINLNSTREKYPSITVETDEALNTGDSKDHDVTSLSSSPSSSYDRKNYYLSPNVLSNECNNGDRGMYRSTSFKTNSSVRNPNDKKMVRFADALGLDLESVRHYSKDHLPKISKSAFADLDLPLNYLKGPFSASTKGRSKSQRLKLVPKFHQPGSDPMFINRIKEQKVCLENTQVNGTNVNGVIKVSNLGFQKLVQVRYTTDNWNTRKDLIADFIPSNSSDTSSDRFRFDIHVPCLRVGDKLIFVIKYIVNGQEFWDNNFGEDYIMQCVSDA